MTKYEIVNAITSYERQISENQRLIREQEDRIFDLKMLNNKISGLETEFETKQQYRRNSLRKVLGKSTTIKIAEFYMEGMSNLLNGIEYQQAYSNFGFSRNRINANINEAYNTISELQQNIRWCQINIDSLRRDLIAIAINEEKNRRKE